jgi:hypothetical protein
METLTYVLLLCFSEMKICERVLKEYSCEMKSIISEIEKHKSEIRKQSYAIRLLDSEIQKHIRET